MMLYRARSHPANEEKHKYELTRDFTVTAHHIKPYHEFCMEIGVSDGYETGGFRKASL